MSTYCHSSLEKQFKLRTAVERQQSVRRPQPPTTSANVDPVLRGRLSTALRAPNYTKHTRIAASASQTAKILQLLHWLNPKLKFSRACLPRTPLGRDSKPGSLCALCSALGALCFALASHNCSFADSCIPPQREDEERTQAAHECVITGNEILFSAS